MEIIELRSVGNAGKQLERQLLEIIDEVDKKREKQTAKLYTRMMIETEFFSIHLLHDKGEFKFEGSELGMRLVSTLKFYGLVNHTIWIEKQKIH